MVQTMNQMNGAGTRHIRNQMKQILKKGGGSVPPMPMGGKGGLFGGLFK